MVHGWSRISYGVSVRLGVGNGPGLLLRIWDHSGVGGFRRRAYVWLAFRVTFRNGLGGLLLEKAFGSGSGHGRMRLAFWDWSWMAFGRARFRMVWRETAFGFLWRWWWEAFRNISGIWESFSGVEEGG